MAHQTRYVLSPKPERLIFTPIEKTYVQELERITTRVNMGEDEKWWASIVRLVRLLELLWPKRRSLEFRQTTPWTPTLYFSGILHSTTFPDLSNHSSSRVFIPTFTGPYTKHNFHWCTIGSTDHQLRTHNFIHKMFKNYKLVVLSVFITDRTPIDAWLPRSKTLGAHSRP
jgi:hypothetical protein